jgi:serine/threonine-protein kinase HipA
MREAIASRLIEEYGSAKAAADAVWSLARENEWSREGELAERFLSRRRGAQPITNGAALNLVVAWHESPVGNLVHDGFEWRWLPTSGAPTPLLVRQTTPGKLPPFLSSLLPEGWLQKVLEDRDERALLRSGRRYLSNVTIVERQADLEKLSRDLLRVRLASHATDGVFTGRYEGPGRSEISKSFEEKLAEIYAREDTPRLSGVQMKAPMNLDRKGVLSPSTGKPFTHILKPAGTGGFESLPVAEWISMTLGRAAGFEVPEIALVQMPDGMPPALLVERFDIRTSTRDKRLLALEDLCSVLDLTPGEKYDVLMERVARGVRALSTAPDDDLLTLLKRGLFAWLIADGDMHLKNMALLKIAEPGSERFRSVRMAPLYDAVCTRVFPRLQHDRLSLLANGKNDNLTRKDFRTFANTAGIQAGAAEAAIDEVVAHLGKAVDGVRLPSGIAYQANDRRVAERIPELCRARLEPLC